MAKTDHPYYMTKTDGNVKFVFMMIAFGLLAYLLQGAQGRQDVVLNQQVTNATAIQASQFAICSDRNIIAADHNALVDELVKSVRQGVSLPPLEQADRIARYEKVKAAPVVCPK